MTLRDKIDTKDICMNIAEELNVSVKVVIKIVNNQFKMLGSHINECKEEDFKLPYIGKVIQKSAIPKNILEDFEI